MSDLLNLEKQLRFYGAYHHNPINIAIHITCVPLILLTAFSLATKSGPLIKLPDWAIVPHLDPNFGTLACFTWSALYVLLEPVAGTALAVLMFAGTAGGDWLIGEYGVSATKWLIGVHIASWIAQFIGHGKFEGRAPALLDNLFQAIFLAPLFVWLELLFALGYRPELQARVEKLVKEDVAKFHAAKKAKQSQKENGEMQSNGHIKSS